MDRPGLQQLLSDIAAQKIDVVVVYKVDRLTRALADFAKIVEQFDERGVSFVSVTQAFNTTSSMGRLTLNVLLSFAQFEREVTGERIRDKIAASKAKGMWMGGCLPLGYDAPPEGGDRTLVMNPTEAATVRLIYDRYLELGAVRDLQVWLAREGYRSKRRVTKAGRVLGDLPFNRGALFHLLKNRVYLGELAHRDTHYPARHTPIVDPAVFAEVQSRLASQAVQRRVRPTRMATAVLKGKIFDAEGRPMTPSFTHRQTRVHRYYVSRALREAQAGERDAIRRVPAQAVEELVLDRLGAFSRSGQPLPWPQAGPVLRRVDVHASTLQLLVVPDAGSGEMQAYIESLRERLKPGERIATDELEPSLLRIVLPVCMKMRGGRTLLTRPKDAAPLRRSKVDQALVRALRASHRLVAELSLQPGSDTLREAKAPVTKYDRQLCNLAFLDPNIQRAILEGRQPQGLCVQALMSDQLPLAWAEQRRVLGFS